MFYSVINSKILVIGEIAETVDGIISQEILLLKNQFEVFENYFVTNRNCSISNIDDYVLLCGRQYGG